MAEFFLFAALMFVDTVIFMIMSMFYTYKPNSLDYHELTEEPVEINVSPPSTESLKNENLKSEGEEHPLQNMTPSPTE